MDFVASELTVNTTVSPRSSHFLLALNMECGRLAICC